MLPGGRHLFYTRLQVPQLWVFLKKIFTREIDRHGPGHLARYGLRYNMLLMSLVTKFRRACKRDGFSGALRLAARNLAILPAAFRPPAKKTRFDEDYGVD